MTTTTTKPKVNNGVNVEALLGAREALTKAPEAAKFKWRATCKWVNGTHSRSSVEGFYGLGAEQKHKTEFTFDADHPEVFASEDKGATPVEWCWSVSPAASPPASRRWRRTATSSCARSRPSSRARWTSRASSASTRTSATATTTSRYLRHRRRRLAQGHRGAGGAVAEALRGVRHRHQPDQRQGQGQVTDLAPASGVLNAAARARGAR